jgi:hypothetical protein
MVLCLGAVFPTTTSSCSRPPPPESRVGETAVQSSYKLTVLEVKACPRNVISRDDEISLGVEMIIENTKDRPIVLSPSVVSISDSTGGSYTGSLAQDCEPPLPLFADLVTKGTPVRGWVTYHVPPKARGFKLTFHPFSTSSLPGRFFLKSPEDVVFDLGRWTPPTASPRSTRPLYGARGIDMCRQTDLKPFADLKVKVLKTEPNTYSRIDAGCTFYLRTPSGRDSTVLVEVETFKSVELAQPNLSSLRKFGSMNYEGSVTGIGDEADAFSSEDQGKGLQVAGYMMRARYENMVVKVWLEAYGKPLIPKATLGEKVRALVEATAKLVPKS